MRALAAAAVVIGVLGAAVAWAAPTAHAPTVIRAEINVRATFSHAIRS